MLVKLFILGRPGSGKSSAAGIIATIARCRGWNTIHINDYDILKEMAQADTTHKNFRQFMHLDLDTCVQRIQKRITYTYTDPPISDNHYVSEEIVRGYYHKDNRQYIEDSLKTDYGIMKLIRIIDNSGSLLELLDNVLWFLDIIFWQENGGSKLISNHISWPLLVLKGKREL